MLHNAKRRWKKFAEAMRAWAEACDWTPTDDLSVRVRELEKQMAELKQQKEAA